MDMEVDYTNKCRHNTARYLLPSNHMHFADFELAAMATYPSQSNVITKLAFATEELYLCGLERTKAARL